MKVARQRNIGFVNIGYASRLMVRALSGCHTINAKILKKE
jgi:hypothetical protein